MPKKFIDIKPLFRKLLLQMDNYVKDNNNRHLFAFLFLLTAREVFKEVHLRILGVGYTHEDIYGNFGYISKKLMERDNYVLANLMKAFMVSQDHPFIP
jgi:hypothetical protein